MSENLQYFGGERSFAGSALFAEATASTRSSENHGISLLWKRLTRRKVVQWGLAYVAASWSLLQGLVYASNIFDWPIRFQQTGTLVLLIGLPFVVVLSWYHGDRGHQKVGIPEALLLTTLILLGASAFWQFEVTLAATLEPNLSDSYPEAIYSDPTIPVERSSEYAVLVAENAALKLRLSNFKEPLLKRVPNYLTPLAAISPKCDN
jgi:hypothetical protein